MHNAPLWLISAQGDGQACATEVLRLLKGQHQMRVQPCRAPQPEHADPARACPDASADATADARADSCATGTLGVLLVVTRGQLPAAARHLAAWRRAAPALGRLCIGVDLEREQLAALMAAGAHDFVAWPCTAAELTHRMQHAAAQTNALVTRAASTMVRGFVFASAECAEVMGRLPTMAACSASVLIVGETGTGKEVCAQAVHYLSARSRGPWVAVNCAAIPAELVESELFGHVKGAYTTALASRAGLVREAEGGTLFLDDIDCLSLSAQGKLLRFLQEFEYRAVGANAVQHADVRVVAASNRDLRAMAQAGSFRQDLFFRLSVLRITLPPLRRRQGDIALLARHFAAEFGREMGRLAKARITDEALAKLLHHSWPGNVRELRHVMERAMLLSAGPDLLASDIEIDGDPPDLDAAPGDMPASVLGGWTPPTGAAALQIDGADAAARAASSGESFQRAKKRVVDTFERHYLESLLLRHRGNVTHAASAAKKNRRAFFELIRKHGIDASSHRDTSIA